MARRITDKEQAKWEAKGVARAQKLIDAGYTFEQVGNYMVNCGFPYQINGDTFELRVWDKPYSRTIGTFTR